MEVKKEQAENSKANELIEKKKKREREKIDKKFHIFCYVGLH